MAKLIADNSLLMDSFSMSETITLDTPTKVKTDAYFYGLHINETVYYGKFKSVNGDISGIINTYLNFSFDEPEFSISGLKNDIISGSNDMDFLYGFNGNDTIYGFNGNDTIYGRDGIDILEGGLGNDKIYGQNGSDDIYGGLGKDILSGGLDIDTFYFDTTLGKSNVDTITDFIVGYSNTGGIVDGDFLYLDKSIFTRLTEGWLSNQELVFGTKALDNNDYLIFNPKKHTLSYDADANGAGKAIAFVVLTGVNTTPDDLSADIYVYHECFP